MQLTRAADYAARIMIHLATLPHGSRPNRAALAESCEIPEHFVGKILQVLSRAGWIASQRGFGGGFTLAVPAERVSLLDIVEVIEGPTVLNVCLQSGMSCNRKGWCPAHCVWQDAQQAMTDVLRRATVGALAKQGQAASGGALAELGT
jgi:Rrf2 family protein